MQLDPHQPLEPQLRGFGGNEGEKLAAASCAHVGYTVFRNLYVDLGGQSAAEADVFAALFSPLRESRVVIECKGGHPSFEDIRKFSTLDQLLDPRPDELVLISRPNTPPNRLDLAYQLGVRIVERGNLTYFALPIIGGANVRPERVGMLNRYLAWQDVHDFFEDQATGIEETRQHLRFLTHDLWSVGPAEQQMARSFDAYQNDHARTWEAVAREKQLDPRDALYEASDEDFEAAMYVVLQHRLMNAYAVTRRTLEIVREESPQQLIATAGPLTRASITRLSAEPRFLYGFPSFLQHYLFVWGGFLVDEYEDLEVAQMASECGITTDGVRHYLAVMGDLYGGGANLFGAGEGLTYFKFVPGACRALGFLHREQTQPTRYAGLQFFGRSDPHYRDALERALQDEGGIAGLRYA